MTTSLLTIGFAVKRVKTENITLNLEKPAYKPNCERSDYDETKHKIV